MVKDIRPQLGRKQPTLLIVVALVAMFFASFYLYRVFEAIPDAMETASPTALMVTLGMMLIMFVLYTNYVITIFRLSSGSRKAWVGVIRFSITYTFMAVLGTIGLSEMLPMEVAFQGTYAMWILIAVVIVLILYMLTGNVRKFFTPGYADEVGLKEWAKYIAGIDPFRGKNLVIPEDLSA